MKKIMQKVLAALARAIIHKYQPEIIGVTGSFGKTSAKEAIFSVLSRRFNVRRNVKNYNNEIGLPLTIIGAASPGRSVFGWLGVCFKALSLIVWRDRGYPRILVLEMAVDRPGDMDYLIKLAPCRVGVLVNIGPVHLEYFKTLEKIAREKFKIITQLKANDWAVLNLDNPLIAERRDEAKCRVLTYGINNEAAEVKASDINLVQPNMDELLGVSETGEKNLSLRPQGFGLNFKLSYQGSTVPVFLPDIFGDHLVYAALAAAAIGLVYEMNLLEISEGLRTFEAPKGRMRLLGGIKYSFIIDDTYNAGPDSVKAALQVLFRLQTNGRKIAVLGDMLELGEYSEEAHKQIGEMVAQNQIDLLITVGKQAKLIAEAAVRGVAVSGVAAAGNAAGSSGLPEDHVFVFAQSERAGRFLQDLIAPHDFILIKGSQGMRMEKIVKEVMAEPLKAGELLVRQERPWE